MAGDRRRHHRAPRTSRRRHRPDRAEEARHGRTTDRLPRHRDRRHRPRPVRRDAARRHGRRGHPRRPGPVACAARRPPTPHQGRARCAAGATSPSTSSTPTAWPRCSTSSSTPTRSSRASARRHGAPRRRPRRVPRPQPEARVRADDRLGPGRPVRAVRPATTSTTSRSPARSPTSAAPARRRCRRSTWSATSAAAGCSSPSASCARSSRRSAAAQGQVVDAAMVDGAATLMTMFWAMSQIGVCDENHRGTNLLDTGAHFYDVYECADGELHLARLDRAAVLRRAAAPHRADRRPAVRQADGQVAVAGPQGPRCAEVFKTQDPRRVVRADGAHRRLLRPGADDGRGGRAPAQRRPPDDRRARRRQAAGAGAALQPHRARDHPRRRSTPARARVEALADWGIPKDRIDELVEDGAVVAS